MKRTSWWQRECPTWVKWAAVSAVLAMAILVMMLIDPYEDQKGYGWQDWTKEWFVVFVGYGLMGFLVIATTKPSPSVEDEIAEEQAMLHKAVRKKLPLGRGRMPTQQTLGKRL